MGVAVDVDAEADALYVDSAGCFEMRARTAASGGRDAGRGGGGRPIGWGAEGGARCGVERMVGCTMVYFCRVL